MQQGPYAIAVKACRWARRNPEAWERLLGLCEWFYRTRPAARLRRGDLFNYAQGLGMSVSDSRAFRFDNNLWSALSRYAVMCRPHLAEVIRFRRSELDSICIADVWHTIVGGPSPFEVLDWRLARGVAA